MANLQSYLPTLTPFSEGDDKRPSKVWVQFFQELITQAGTSGPGDVTSIGPLTDNAVVVGQGGSDIATLSGLGSSGDVLTSQGAGSPPHFVAPAAGGITQLTGGVTAGPGSGSQVATVVTNANLTGPITSVGNATAIGSQTGTGSTFAMSASPALTGVPTAPTAAGGTNTTQLATTAFVTAAVPTAAITQLTGDVTAGPGSGSQAATLAASGVVAATYGDSTHVSQIAVDAKGRITSASNVAIAVGTVTSVGLSLPAIFTVTVSPITGSGSLTAVLATETANTVWAGPTTGAAATPAFRALVAADLPSGTGTVTSIATTSPISGGTITGTGTLSLLVNVDFGFTANQSVTKTVNATSADGVMLINSTAAAVGAQQWSPRLRLTGQGWKTTATAASQAVDWIVENQPVQGAANPTTTLVFSSQVNGAGFAAKLTLGSDGTLTGNGAGQPTLTWPGGIFAGAGQFFAFSGGSQIRNDNNNVVGIRNGSAAQLFRLYNTFTTVSTSGEWWKQDWQTTANQFRMGAAKGSSAGTARVASWDYGGTEASPAAAITVPITSGAITFGGSMAFTNLAISNAVPTIASGFGAGATIAGIVGGFRITCGTVPGVGGTVNFNTTFANAPVCFVQDETTGVLGIAAPTTTTVVVSGLTLIAGQTIAVLVFGY